MALASAEAAGYATEDELAALTARPDIWVATLRQLVKEAEAALRSAQHLTGPERTMVLDDLTEDRRQLQAALRRLAGPTPEEERAERLAAEREKATRVATRPGDDGVTRLQASWFDGQIVLWAGSSAGPGTREELDKLLAEAAAGTIGWADLLKGVTDPDGRTTAAVAAPVDDVLGWLVGVGAGQLAADAAPSLRWLGRVAAWGTELVALGRMVPTLSSARGGAAHGGGSGSAGGRTAGSGQFVVKWSPAAVDSRRLSGTAGEMPGAVGALDKTSSPTRVTRSVLSAVVDAVCRAGARRLVAPASVPVARTHTEVSEAVLAGFNGTPFGAGAKAAAEMTGDLEKWGRPVLGEAPVPLTVRLDPPDADGAWLLHVEATLPKRGTLPVHRALGEPAPIGRDVDAALRRLERLVPAFARPTERRGQVVLAGSEAWELMTRIGPVLSAVGFDVRVPAYSAKKPSTRLALHAEPIATGPSQVGAQQLAYVRWSVLVDDVELDAADIRRLAAEARPMVKVGSGWVELDRADLDAAARALAERSKTTQMSGAAILRHAVGLEGDAVAVAGEGWAADLIQGASDRPEPRPAPEGFEGELRSYQAEARGWLGFLDNAGLGGILALDMGLGKTPVVLAHLLETADDGPALVIAPPAVLGNWAREAERFTPDLRVHVHHGSERVSDADEVATLATEDCDVVLTTYGTAARDADALAAISWHRLVIDEAQTIKNPNGLTAQELRRIPARAKLALTGTPVENGLGDLWAILDFVNPGLVGERAAFVNALSGTGAAGGAAGMRAGEGALRALNGLLTFRRTKAEKEIAAELPDKIDELDHCGMTTEQVGLYQAVLDKLIVTGPTPGASDDEDPLARKGHILAAITALKQICDHPAAYLGADDDGPLEGRSGKLTRLDELIEAIYAAGERALVFTHFARWGERLAEHLTARFKLPVECYHGGLTRVVRDRMVAEFQAGKGPGALVLSIKAGGAGLNLTAANHVILYDRWWNPAVEDQARDRAWRIGQRNTVICHRLVCPGTVDERVEEVVAGKRRIADMVLPASSSLGDLTPDQLRIALGLRPDALADIDANGHDDPDEAISEEGGPAKGSQARSSRAKAAS